MPLVRVGTCAWADHEDYYPKGLPAGERLGYYARHFSIVEVDSSFYRLQPSAWYATWAAKTPAGFVFNVKAYGALTRHHREPRPGEADLAEVFKRFAGSIEPLIVAGKLRTVHFQFPPWFTCQPENREWLYVCREAFPQETIAIEFRHVSWFSEANRAATLSLLRQLQAVHVICDAPQIGSGTVPAVFAVTNPQLAVMRLHGRNAQTWYKKVETTAQRFDYLYSRDELQALLNSVHNQIEPGAEEIHLLMNNNRSNYAVRNALDLMEMLGQPVPIRDERGVPALSPEPGQQMRFFE